MSNLGTFSGDGLGFGMAFSLYDDFTANSRNIQSEMGRLDGATTQVAQSVSRSTSMMERGFKALAMGALISAPFVVGIGRLAELSDQMADVQKSTGMSNAQVSLLKNNLEGLDTRTKVDDLLDISKIGGQLGVPTQEMLGYASTVDKAAVALKDEFAGGVEQVSNELGKLKQLYQDTSGLTYAEGINRIGSSVNALGAAGAATGSNMTDFALRMGQLGDLAPKIADSLGFAATLQEIGMSADIASGGLTNLLLQAANNAEAFSKQMGLTNQEFLNLYNGDPNAFLIKLLESFQGMKNSDVATTLKGMRVGTQESIKVVTGLSANLDILRQRQALSNAEFAKGTSLAAEFEIKNNTLAARMEKFSKTLDSIKQSLGVAALPIFEAVGTVLEKIGNALRALASNPAGRFLLGLVAATGALLVVWGSMMLLGGGIRWMIARLAMSFSAATAAEITNALVTSRSVVPAMRALATATWTALAPFLPIIAAVALFAAGVFVMYKTLNSSNPYLYAFGLALMFAMGPLGWIAGAIILVKRAFSEFDAVLNGSKEASGGFVGVLQKVGGVLRGLQQIWSSWDNASGTFTLTEPMEKALEKLGIKQLVLNLGTWVARIKAFISGIGEGIKEVWNGIKSFIGSIVKAFEPVASAVTSWDNAVAKNTSSMEKWKQYGKIAGYVIVGVLAAVAIAFIAMGVSAIISMLPIIIVIAAVVAAIYLIYQAIQGLIWLWSVVKEAAISAFNTIYDYVAGFFTWFFSLPGMALDWGVQLVQNIWAGFSAMWDKFKQWVTGIWEDFKGVFGAVFDFVTAPVRMAADLVMGEDPTTSAQFAPASAIGSTVGLSNYSGNMESRASTKGGFARSGAPTVLNNKTTELQNITIPVYLDGDPIHKSVMDREQLNQARK